MEPRLSVIVPTFNNLDVLRRCLDSWERFASDQPVELLVIEDGCKDATPRFLEERSRTEWGKRFLRWFHEQDVHQLKCNNRGFQEARAPLSLVWDDDMFLDVPWLVPELLETFDAYPDLGLLSLIRGLVLSPLEEPITEWEHLHDPRRMVTTVGPGMGLNWLRLSEVDIVIRPWVVRRACLEKVGPLDEAFCPVEWDEADLAYRIRVNGGWRVATHDYERGGAFTHLGSTTLGKMNVEKHHRMVLPNGQRFHQRWGDTIRREHPRARKTWWRRIPPESLPLLLRQAGIFGYARARNVLRRLTTRRGPAPSGHPDPGPPSPP
ncbi:MAG TPA: glycosyltransferase [Myxococcaceae bacterium]|nr:glycosyltransferase [Myxococcaceae bacterium]